MKWINLKDKSPNLFTPVQVKLPDDTVQVDWCIGEGVFKLTKNPVSWLPLPGVPSFPPHEAYCSPELLDRLIWSGLIWDRDVYGELTHQRALAWIRKDRGVDLNIVKRFMVSNPDPDIPVYRVRFVFPDTREILFPDDCDSYEDAVEKSLMWFLQTEDYDETLEKLNTRPIFKVGDKIVFKDNRESWGTIERVSFPSNRKELGFYYVCVGPERDIFYVYSENQDEWELWELEKE